MLTSVKKVVYCIDTYSKESFTMSEMELNKGKLIPTNKTPAEYAEIAVTGKLPKFYDSKEECLRENEDDYNVTIINDMVYLVEFEIRGECATDFADARKNEDGSIDFLTYHYNGSAHWTEIVDEIVNEKNLVP